MIWLRWFLLGLAIGLGVLGFSWRGASGAGAVATDFATRLDDATVRRPSAATFTVRDVSIGGDTRASIAAAHTSRIAWDQVMPDHAWLDVSLGVRQDAWTTPGSSVLFRVGLSFDGRYEELVTQVMDPHTQPADRRWRPVLVDLSAYAGRTVSLIFNTAPGQDGGTRLDDVAAWGTPRLVVR